MKTRVLPALAMFWPLLLSADTLLMKDGTRFNGTFNSANGQTVVFTESNGNRQSLNRDDVQELQFGRADNNSQNGRYNSNQDRGNSGSSNSGSNATADPGYADALDRLQTDLDAAMSNTNLADSDRQSLRVSRETLRNAVRQARNGQSVNQRDVRLAISNIRSVMDSGGIQGRDRDMLRNDMQQLRSGNGNGRDY